jgi:hypothetical protein
MLSGHLCERSTPRVELNQRARDSRLGLERIERLVVRAPDRFSQLRQSLHHLGALICGHIPRKSAA